MIDGDWFLPSFSILGSTIAIQFYIFRGVCLGEYPDPSLCVVLVMDPFLPVVGCNFQRRAAI